jgi:hypothetical protein
MLPSHRQHTAAHGSDALRGGARAPAGERQPLSRFARDPHGSRGWPEAAHRMSHSSSPSHLALENRSAPQPGPSCVAHPLPDIPSDSPPLRGAFAAKPATPQRTPNNKKCCALIDKLLNKAAGSLLFVDAIHPDDVKITYAEASQACGQRLAAAQHPLSQEQAQHFARDLVQRVGDLCANDAKRAKATAYFAKQMHGFSGFLAKSG